MKNCLMCKHCDYYQGLLHYSELVLGSDVFLCCSRGKMLHAVWGNLFDEAYTRQQLREALATAETCESYEPDTPTEPRG